jgi:ABC-type Fe3+ transport system permease subunit
MTMSVDLLVHPVTAAARMAARELPETGNGPAIALAAVQLALALALYLVGRWGMGQAARLVPPSMPEPERGRRTRMYRRGAIACLLAAAVLAGTVLVSLVLRWLP